MTPRLFIPCGALLAGLSACATPALPERPAVALPADYVAGYRPALGDEAPWWRGFGEPELNLLIQQALDANRDIEAARERFAAAAALVRAERSDRRPDIAGVGDAGVAISTDASDLTAGAGTSLFLNPDLSGRLSAEVEAAAANALAAEYFVADTRRLIAASVAEQYIELKRTQARLDLLAESTDLQLRTLRIVQFRFEAGLSANLDVRRAAADLAQTRAQRGLLELARAQAAHALAILTAQPPSPAPATDPGESEIPDFEGGPPRGVPADLVRRRPDLLVAEAQLIEAGAIAGAERADLLPSLTIPGQILAGDGTVGGLFADAFSTIAAALDLPIFDGGRRRAEIAAADAEAAARFADYQQAVLVVLAEVENALVAIESYDERISDLNEAIEQSQAAFSQSDALYREGLASLFDVLDAQRQLIASREDLIDSRAELATSIVALYAAVGAPTELPPSGGLTAGR